jgi:hypothetical protein
MIKHLKLLAIALVSALGGFGQFDSPSGAQAQSVRLFEIVGMNTPFEQRSGIDDGVAFVVHFAGDTRGSLDVCG